MPDDEDFSDELQSIDGEGDEGLPPEGDEPLEEGADAPEHARGSEEGDDEPGTERQAGAQADQSQGAQGNRGLSRQARLARELKETKERALQHERELNDIKARLAQATQPRGETPEQRQARLDQMTTEERFSFLLAESDQRNQLMLRQQQFQMEERADQQAFQSRMADDPRAKKYAQEVEQTLQSFRQSGVYPKREAVYAYVLGLKVMNAKKGVRGQTEGVQRRRDATNTRPATTGGDVGRAGRGRSLEQKLDGVLL
jgi:hypothetical protein